VRPSSNGPGVELVERERPVVERRGQAEPELHQRLLARAVTVVHAAHLGHGLVALVDHEQEVVREVVEQRRRWLARRTSREVPRVVLDAVAVADLLQHLEVEVRALLEPLPLEQLALGLEHLETRLELGADRADRLYHALPGGHVVGLREERDALHLLDHVAAQGVEADHALDLVAEILDAHAAVLVGGQDLEHVAARPEAAVEKIERGAHVLHLGQARQGPVHAGAIAAREHQQHAEEGLGRAQAVDAGDRGHDDDVPPLEQGLGRAQAEPVDLLVDARLLLDVGVRLRHVGFGLVVVVVGDEVLDRVVREEGAELLVELGRERLVVREDEGRAVDRLDHLGDREGLARAGDAEQHLLRVAALHAGGELADRRGLIALRLEGRDEAEAVHLVAGLRASPPPQVSLPAPAPRPWGPPRNARATR